MKKPSGAFEREAKEVGGGGGGWRVKKPMGALGGRFWGSGGGDEGRWSMRRREGPKREVMGDW